MCILLWFISFLQLPPFSPFSQWYLHKYLHLLTLQYLCYPTTRMCNSSSAGGKTTGFSMPFHIFDKKNSGKRSYQKSPGRKTAGFLMPFHIFTKKDGGARKLKHYLEILPSPLGWTFCRLSHPWQWDSWGMNSKSWMSCINTTSLYWRVTTV